LRFARFASSRTLLQSPGAAKAEAEAEVGAVDFTGVAVEAVDFTAGAVGLLRFTVGAAGVAGMAEEVGIMDLLPMAAWPPWVMGGVAMH
jgi:hypothetical protein